MSRTHRWIAAAGWLFAALAISSTSPLLIDTIARAQAPNRVALVVQYGDGTVYTQCVEFAEDEITGLDVLLRADLGVVYSGGGASAQVCKIGPDGCDSPGNCFCQCSGTDCKYWSYWHLVDGAWQYSPVGGGLYKVRDGAVEGWTWGIGTPSDAPQPPRTAFEDVCAPPTATPPPTDTPPPTATATATEPPPATALPTVTATQTVPPPTTTPIPAATPQPDAPQGAGWGNYAAFGGIVVVLVVVGVIVLRKR
jgi:hypothetical protein